MPKMNDDWTVIPNLWGGIVAPPSAMKTPALKEALAPIYKLEKAYLETFANDSKILESQAMVTEIRIKSAEKRLKEAVEQHEESTIQALQGEITALKAQVAAEKPVLKRLIANDATIEKLTELLNQNPKGMLVFRDELYGFLMSMEKEGHEMYRSFFLESWNGSGSYVTDRIGRGTIATPALCLAILGGIQPDRLNAYFSSVMKGGSGDDGFLSRLQLMVYPDLPKEWELIDQKPDQIARNRAYRVFQRVSELDFIGHGFEAGPDVPIARFNGDAQEFYYNWLKELELRLRSETIESAAFESHLGKYRSLMPSLALLFHLIKFADGDTDSPHIDLEAAKLSVKWCAYLEGHAKRIYSGIIQPEIQSAHAIAKKIQIGKVTDGMTVRDLYRKQWTSLSDQKTVEAGLGLLENLNWLKIMEASPTGLGARSEVIRLHPDFLGEAPNAH
jgi:putative DNA primase/helicase